MNEDLKNMRTRKAWMKPGQQVKVVGRPEDHPLYGTITSVKMSYDKSMVCLIRVRLQGAQKRSRPSKFLPDEVEPIKE